MNRRRPPCTYSAKRCTFSFTKNKRFVYGHGHEENEQAKASVHVLSAAVHVLVHEKQKIVYGYGHGHEENEKATISVHVPGEAVPLPVPVHKTNGWKRQDLLLTMHPA